ncbi:hypothetical protein D4R78_07990 [bacterium]|nr:MAG: hypothetical protein D4R78_07990 [bacterium]
MKKILMLLCLGLTGCAINSGVVSMGKDTYMVSRQAATGFSGSGAQKAKCFQEAGKFCEKQGKKLYVVSTSEAHPPYLLANFPKAEVQFMCLDANDPRLKTGEVKTIQQLGQSIKTEGDDNRALETKLKTLNKLLSDGLITKNEFDEQKKKLLNDYTNK